MMQTSNWIDEELNKLKKEYKEILDEINEITEKLELRVKQINRYNKKKAIKTAKNRAAINRKLKELNLKIINYQKNFDNLYKIIKSNL